MVRDRVVGHSPHLNLLQQSLPHRRENVAQGDDHVDAQAEATDGLHQPKRHMVPLRQSLLSLADAALQRLRIAVPSVARGHGGLHDLVCPLLTDRLRKELGSVVNVQYAHVLHHLRGRGHSPQGRGLAMRHGLVHGILGRVLHPHVVQRVRLALPLTEVLQGLGVGLQQVLAPSVERKRGTSGRLGHLPVLAVVQVQRVVHRAEEGVQQHLGRV
mmetsp:Transcript_37684/g.117188  ORF Transcript_37684/g.117188 Transcript_37684/m.117188 type:complete len:214 (+) Transcript_37684:256-897(+)